MTWRLSHIERNCYWPNGGSLGPGRMDRAKIGWHFWCNRTQAGEDYNSRVKMHSFSTFREACKAQSAMRLELEQAHQPEGAAQ